jgi:hypothetical protein
LAFREIILMQFRAKAADSNPARPTRSPRWLRKNPMLLARAHGVLHLGFGAYHDPDDVPRLRKKAHALVAPLGPAGPSEARGAAPVAARRLAWAFLGRAQSPARAHMLRSFLEASRARNDKYALRVTAGLDEDKAADWRRGDAWRVPGNESSWRRGDARRPPGVPVLSQTRRPRGRHAAVAVPRGSKGRGLRAVAAGQHARRVLPDL